jgi:transcriptional regulator with XRE-family HTH domain
VPITGQRVVRRALGRRLVRLRVAAGRTRRDVVEAKLGLSEPTLHRIETGKTPISAAKVRALCSFYGTDDTITEALAELALGTSHEEWWDASPVIPDWFRLYVALEVSATRIFGYHGEAVPAELQTEPYARAVLAATRTLTDEDLDQHVKLRRQRQHTLLARQPPVTLTVILGEGALTRPVGGDAVLNDQIRHLHQLARHDHIDINVLPSSAGAHAAMNGPFRILTFDSPDDPDVVYLEPHIGAVYLEHPTQLAAYRRITESISQHATPIDAYP